jgi:tRNA pseudouridine38-40 synthase
VSQAPQASRAGGAEEGSVRWRLIVAYDGSGFHGFAAQEGRHTVAGVLAGAIARVSRSAVTLTCAGRTDAGVHATGQVVHFDLPEDRSAALDPDALLRSCNRLLAPAVVVREAEVAPRDFDARRSATARRYRYLVVNAPVADPLLAGLTWHVVDPLDRRRLDAAADVLLGEHDFRAFCRRVPGTPPDQPILRRVLDVRWTDLPRPTRSCRSSDPGGGSDGPTERPDSRVGAGLPLLPAVGTLLAFEIEANAFCHQMVRSVMGTLVDVGRSRKRPSDVVELLRSGDRQAASQPAPPQGLTLLEVRYGDR